MFRSSRRWSRVLAALCGVAVLLGATACHDGGSTMKAGMGQESGPKLDTDGEPFIHANHNRGADPNIRVGQVDQKGLEDYTDELTDWGLQQTPDWLEICNTINKHELRKLGIDPQKDLQQRKGGDGKRWACGWKHNKEKLVVIARIDAPMEVASRPPRFTLDHTTTVNGEPARVGSVLDDEPLSQACTIDYKYEGQVYSITYKLLGETQNKYEACDGAEALAQRG